MKNNDLKQEKAKKVEGENLPQIVRVKDFIFRNYDIRFNEIQNEYEIKAKNETNYKILNEDSLMFEILSNNYKISEKHLRFILGSDFVPKINAIRDYFEGLGTWQAQSKDGGITCENDYIGQLCSYIKLKNEEEREQFEYHFRKHLIRCVACSLGLDFNKQCFVIVSSIQNIGKSSFIRFLLPPKLGENFYSETFRPESKDSMIDLSRLFILNIDELANLSKHDIDLVKKHFSTDRINERLPFGRKNSYLKRIVNFFATTNNDEFLTDETGSVRWICFEIVAIDFNYSQNINIDDVWRQAYNLLNQGEAYQLTKEDIELNEKRNKKHQKTSVEYDLIVKHFAEDTEKKPHNFITSTEVYIYLTEKYPTIRIFPNNIGKALKIIASQKSFRRNGGESIKGYFLQNL